MIPRILSQTGHPRSLQDIVSPALPSERVNKVPMCNKGGTMGLGHAVRALQRIHLLPDMGAKVWRLSSWRCGHQLGAWA